LGLFDSSRRRQLDDLEREVLANPTPQNMVSLIERYMAAGQEDKALEMARKACEKFPNSEKVQVTFQNVRRLQLQSEISEINKSLRKGPSRAHYERLADIYHREMGNRTKAFEVALEGLAKFPVSDGLHMISGQIRMDRFHQDFVANDFVESVRHFEKAASINPKNYKAMVSLARLYAEVGAYYKSKPVLEQVLKASPGDPTAEGVLAIAEANLSNAAPNLDDALAEIEGRRALTAAGLEVSALFDAGGARGHAGPAVSPMKIDAFLVGYEGMNGYKCSVVLGRDGGFVAGHTRGHVPKERFAQVLQDVYLCSEDGGRKMDIGTFVSGELDTPVGRVVMSEWKGYVFGILAEPTVKKEEIQGAVDKFVAFLSVG
jgi:thioredoxin-like negative regulator of GroEL